MNFDLTVDRAWSLFSGWLILGVVVSCFIGCDPVLSEPKAEIAQDPAIAQPVVGAWSGWRGDKAQAIATDAQLSATWPHELRPVWTQPLDTGWSSPIVSDNRVFITDRVDDKERLLAFDAASGAPLWTVENPVSFEPHAVGRNHGNGPKSTPTTDRERVYSLGIAGWLQCVDAKSGQVLWRHHLPAEFSKPYSLPSGEAEVHGTEHVIVPTTAGRGGAVPLFGYTGSLLLIEGKLILSVGGELGGTIMAFDAGTGDLAWKALDEHVSYSSPTFAEFDGVAQVVVMTGPRVVGLTLADGALLWSHPFQVQYDESISTPAVAKNLVIVTGDSHPATALRIERATTGDRGAAFHTTIAWENTDLSSYLSSLVTRGDHVYGMADDGQFACARLTDGKTIWQGGNHGYYCSPTIINGDRLLCLNEKGSLLTIAASPVAYQELETRRVATQETWTAPAAVGDRIYVRSANRLSCFRLGS